MAINPLTLDFITNAEVRKLPIVNTPSIYNGTSSTEYHPQGIFSEEIFGLIDSRERNVNLGAIDLGVKIIHPYLYYLLTEINSLHGKIIEGKAYAKFVNGKFIESDISDGATGFNFFIKNLPDYKLSKKEISALPKTKYPIGQVLMKYSLAELITDRFIMLPAGIRERSITDNGKILESEVNSMYIKLINATASAHSLRDIKTKDEAFSNIVALRIQRNTNEIMTWILDILQGKKGFVMDKFLKRSIAYGTRNVLTAMSSPVDTVDSDVHPLAITMGVYQYAKSIFPYTLKIVKDMFLEDRFDVETGKVRISSKSETPEYLDISEKEITKWTTDTGIEELLNLSANDYILNSPILIDGRPLWHIDKVEGVYKINDEGAGAVLTYGQMWYLAIYEKSKELPCYTTRYPIVRDLNIVPSPEVNVETTETSEVADIEVSGRVVHVTHWPKAGSDEVWMKSVVTPRLIYDLHGSDVDGDTISIQCLYTTKAIAETKSFINSTKFVINADGELVLHAGNYMVDNVCKSLTA